VLQFIIDSYVEEWILYINSHFGIILERGREKCKICLLTRVQLHSQQKHDGDPLE